MEGVRGSNPLSSTLSCLGTSRTPEPLIRVRGFCVCGVFRAGVRVSVRSAGSCGRVERELAEELAGGGVDDADVQVLDQHVDGGPGVGSADADVVEAAVVAEGELAVGVDAVGADAVVGVG